MRFTLCYVSDMESATRKPKCGEERDFSSSFRCGIARAACRYYGGKRRMWNMTTALRAAGLLVLAFMLTIGGARAATDDIFTVRGVKVDVTDKDAATAKVRAIQEAQMKAFHTLLTRIADEDAWQRLSKLGPRKIGRMMSSLSIEEEHTGARRYIGRLTIRFRPARVRQALQSIGKGVITRQSPKILIIPVWRTADGPMLWEDNPWRRAWNEARAESALVPVVVPVGDMTDRQTLSAAEALEGDAARLGALRLRYDVDTVLVAVAEPVGENAVHAVMTGDSPVGNIAFDKVYKAAEGGLEAAARQAVERFLSVMTYKWKKKVAAEHAAKARAAAMATRLPVIVPFRSLREWQSLRARLVTTPGVDNVDVSTLSGNGAEIVLTSRLPLDSLRSALQQSRFQLMRSGSRWVLRAF